MGKSIQIDRGEHRASVCERCGAAASPGARFCIKCGAPLPTHRETPTSGRSRRPRQPALTVLAVALALALLVGGGLIARKWIVERRATAGHDGKVLTETDIAYIAAKCGIEEATVRSAVEHQQTAAEQSEALRKRVKDADADETQREAETLMGKLRQEGVISAWEYDPVGETVAYTVSGGGMCLIELRSEREQGAPYTSGMPAVTPADSGTGSGDELPAVPSGTPDAPKVLQLFAHTMDPAVYRFYARQSWAEMGADVTIWENPTVEDFRRLGEEDWDVIVLNAHGGERAGGQLYIRTEQALDLDRENIADWINGGLCSANGFWSLTPEFFALNYSDKQLPGIFVSTSGSFFGDDTTSPERNFTMAEALLKAGADAVVGFHNSVSAYYAMHFARDMVSHLLCGEDMGTAMHAVVSDFGVNDGEYLIGRSPDGYPCSCLPADGELRLRRSLSGEPVEDIQYEAEKYLKVYGDFLARIARDNYFFQTDVRPEGSFSAVGFAYVDVTGDALPELLLVSNEAEQSADMLDGLVAMTVGPDDQVSPLFYQAIDPVVPHVYLDNNRWLKTIYHGSSGAATLAYVTMHGIEYVLRASVYQDEDVKDYAQTFFVEAGQNLDWNGNRTWVGNIASADPTSVQIDANAFRDMLNRLGDPAAAEREILFWSLRDPTALLGREDEAAAPAPTTEPTPEPAPEAYVWEEEAIPHPVEGPAMIQPGDDWRNATLVYTREKHYGWTEVFESILYDGAIAYSYEVPQILIYSDDALAINEEIASLYRNYVDERGIYNREDNGVDFILERMSWEASVSHDRILSVLITTVTCGKTHEDTSYRAYCIDLQTGRRLSGGEVLNMIGVNSADFSNQAWTIMMEVARSGYYTVYQGMNGVYPSEDDPSLQLVLDNTMLWNMSTELIERGLYLADEENIYTFAQIDDISAYSRWVIICVNINEL